MIPTDARMDASISKKMSKPLSSHITLPSYLTDPAEARRITA